ncbi:MAG: polyamine aminopropyltransferase [Nitrospiria bacterium]
MKQSLATGAPSNMSSDKCCKWFVDHLSPHETHSHGVDSLVFSKKSDFQEIEIVDLRGYGRCLILDGKMQSSESDEYIYHETLVHPAMLTHPNPRNVFVVGGGEGATLREVLRHSSVEHVLMVDIDREVVEACKQHLPQWHQGAFDDSRVELQFLDARKHLEETETQYDVIIIDISEPVEEGPAYLLYTREFYHVVMARLSEAGVIALQAGTTATPYLINFTAVCQTLLSVFPVVAPCQASIPSFGLPWGFALASKLVDPASLSPGEIDKRIAERINSPLKSYDGKTHLGQFALSKHLRCAIQEERRIIEDNQPLYLYV